MDLIQLLENRLKLAKTIRNERGGFCTYKETSILLGLEPSSVRFYVNKNKLQKTKIGTSVFIHIDQLAKFYELKEDRKIKELKEHLKTMCK